MKYLKNKPKGRSRKQNRAVLLWVLVCLVVVSISSFTLAKYVLQMRDRATAVPTDFFFQSDYLTSEGNEEYEVYSGVIGFKLMNHDGVNVTDRNITYGIVVKDANDQEVTTATINGVADLTGGTKSVHSISISGLQVGTYTVTATSTVPYEKSISAEFVVKDMDGSTFYKIDDSFDGEYCVLHVYTGSSGVIKVSYGADLATDNTDPRMATWTPGGNNVWNGSPNAHYEFIFFENTPKYYQRSETKLTGDTITITAN